MFSPERLVFLDADGTIVDAFSAMQKTFSQEDMDIGDLHRFQQRRNLFKYLGGLKEFPKNLFGQISGNRRRRLIQTLTQVYREETPLFEGMPEFLNQLIHQPNVRVGIVTRNITHNPLETLSCLFKRHNVDIDQLDFFVHIPLKETKVTCFNRIRHEYNSNPALTYACGDEKKDYDAALMAGIIPIMVSYGFESIRRLTEKADIPKVLISQSPAELIQRVQHTLGIADTV